MNRQELEEEKAYQEWLFYYNLFEGLRALRDALPTCAEIAARFIRELNN